MPDPAMPDPAMPDPAMPDPAMPGLATPDLAMPEDSGALVERMWLDESSWVDVSRGWLDDADEVYVSLLSGMPWKTSSVFRYDRSIEEPRLGSYWRPGNPTPHPAIIESHRTLQRRYKVRFDGCGMAYYRNERDSVAFHRDPRHSAAR
ncbi:MAG: hypothetical protein V9G12_17585 [Microthrixaceae bacterium]